MTEYQVTAYYITKVRREIFVEAENEEELKEKIRKCDYVDEWENEILESGELVDFEVNQ